MEFLENVPDYEKMVAAHRPGLDLPYRPIVQDTQYYNLQEDLED